MWLNTLNDLQINNFPPAAYRFIVSFSLLNPLDIGFQTVSGISSQVETHEIRQGGENIFMQRLPTRITYNNLVLTRGMVIGSPLNIELNLAFSTMTFSPSQVLVVLLDDIRGAEYIPAAAWLFQDAYPVKWEISDLDGSKNAVVIETMELAYSRFQSVRI